MSGTLILKNGLMAAACVAGLTLSACASGQHSSSSRYGSVYDYESGGSSSCNAGPCGAVVAAPMVHHQQMIGGQQVSPGVVYADCSVVSGMNCNAQTTVYTPPAPVYNAPAQCPTGTTSNGKGSCMEAGGGYNYSTTTTSTYSGEAAPCPTGTTPNGDGTCMEASSGYDFSSTTTSSYSGSTTSYSGEAAPCPSGTTSNGDGTCMESSNVVIYGSETTTGYVAPTTYTAPTTYLPIRK